MGHHCWGLFVSRLFQQYQTPIHVYHNLYHTKTVALRANEIALNYSLTEKEFFIVASAAWFHDVGHLFGLPHMRKKVLLLCVHIYGKTWFGFRHIEFH